jgi:hypothetical protein
MPRPAVGAPRRSPRFRRVDRAVARRRCSGETAHCGRSQACIDAVITDLGRRADFAERELGQVSLQAAVIWHAAPLGEGHPLGGRPDAR